MRSNNPYREGTPAHDALERVRTLEAEVERLRPLLDLVEPLRDVAGANGYDYSLADAAHRARCALKRIGEWNGKIGDHFFPRCSEFTCPCRDASLTTRGGGES